MIRPDIEFYKEKYKGDIDPWFWVTTVPLLIEYIEYLEAQDRRRDWPSALHEQYLFVLDERDALQEKLDEYEKIPKRSGRLVFGDDCEHDWESGDYSDGISATGPGTFYFCRKCGLEKDD